jgi:hypothetical protein
MRDDHDDGGYPLISDELVDWLLAGARQRLPCPLCGALTPPGQRTEVKIPGAYIAEWDMGVPGVPFALTRPRAGDA